MVRWDEGGCVLDDRVYVVDWKEVMERLVDVLCIYMSFGCEVLLCCVF